MRSRRSLVVGSGLADADAEGEGDLASLCSGHPTSFGGSICFTSCRFFLSVLAVWHQRSCDVASGVRRNVMWSVLLAKCVVRVWPSGKKVRLPSHPADCEEE